MHMPSVEHRLVSKDTLRSDGRTMVAKRKVEKSEWLLDGVRGCVAHNPMRPTHVAPVMTKQCLFMNSGLF